MNDIKMVTVAVPSVLKEDQDKLFEIARAKGYRTLSSYLRILYKETIEKNSKLIGD